MFTYAGPVALVSIIVHLLCIVVTWWALQSLKLDALFKKGKTNQIRVLYVLVTITIGASVARFLMDYYMWATQWTSLL
ncbi:DUF1146 domain-containing protein [Bacillaceae bacterium SIJ1]|uniref:DUF1146 family protein n=1 Tax=Litoribacterium kuwaitense TaxID=1398745 RepID=UPI0013EB1002|nr:DUF1146 family protein [Litoribacterium kuwaitense]NGP44741.1 DUF1146 domain-containing protein [Litoribacterium kuwaitense]